MRSSWIMWVGPESNDKRPYWRLTERHTERRKGNMKTEVEIGAMQCEERQHSPGAGRGNDGSSLRDSGRTAALVRRQ